MVSTPRASPRPRSAAHPVIGMLMTSLMDLYQDQWLGAADAAGAQGVSLITFVGREFSQPHGYEGRANAVYELIDPERLDGLVVWTTALSQFVGRDRLVEFLARFGDLPMVSVEQVLPGMPTVLMDDRNGMSAAVSHLIEVHGHRRVAFVRGAERHLGAQERFQGYLEALVSHELEPDPDLISPASGLYSAATARWTERLVQDRARRPGAIAVAHDDWAMGVMTVLKAAGVDVPNEVAVVGYDDVIGVRRHGLWLEGFDREHGHSLELIDLDAVRPLTTVKAPFRELATRAVELVAAQIRGEPVPDIVTVSTTLVVRRSCGCTSAGGPDDVTATPVPRRSDRTRLDERLAAAVAEPLAGIVSTLPADWSTDLVAAFLAVVDGATPDHFLATLEDLVWKSQGEASALLSWAWALAALQTEAGTALTDEAMARTELLWPSSRRLLTNLGERFAKSDQLAVEKVEEAVRLVGQKVITALDASQLADILATELSTLGIRACCLATYERPESEPVVEPESRITLAPLSRALLLLVDGTRIELEPDATLFPSQALSPANRMLHGSPRNLVVLPLYFKDQQLGFVVFELGPRVGWVYEVLQAQLSSALEAALLVDRERTALHERARLLEQAQARNRLLEQEITARILAERALERARAELEDRVVQRTAELARANATLTEQMAERERAEETRIGLEAQLRLAQKMEALGRLAGGIAHDFNNLLVVINGYSDLLLKGAPIDASVREDLEQIRRAGERAATLTRQLLAFGRKQVLEPRVVSLNDVVLGIEPMLRRLIGEDVRLVTRLVEAPAWIRADPGQLEQVVVNLAVNARDAMPGGGTMTIETAETVIDDVVALMPGVPAGPYVRLSVSDTGVGMDSETRSRLFEPFFTTKSLGHGTGLGLATVFGIVQQSGGHIDVTSELNQGTTFRIHLPLAARPESSQGTEVAPSTHGWGSETILLVEDEPSVRRASRHFLESRGYHVIESAQARDAIRLFEQHGSSIDLVITDVVMPETNGRELAERLVQIRPTLRVLYVSGYTEEAILRHGLAEGGVALLEKPFTADMLVTKVRELLDHDRATTPTVASEVVGD